MTGDERLRPSDKAPADEASVPRRTPRFGFDMAPRSVDRGHSRYVRGLKVVLPASAAIIVILVFAWPQIHLRDPIPDPESLRIRPHDTADLTVQGVRYVGTDARNRRYTVTAASTRQAHADADRVALEKPEADMTLGDGHWVALTAESGTFDRESSELDLAGTVRFFHDDGYQMTTDSASIDFRAGRAQGDRPVTAQGPVGTAAAEGFRVLDQGRTVVFTGKASMLLNQQAREGGT